MLQVLAHPDLSHQSVLVTVHPCELTHMREDVLKAVGELEGVYVSETVLDVRVYHQFGESEDFSAKMEGVTWRHISYLFNYFNKNTESGLLSFFGGQGLHWLQVEVVVEMQVVQVLTMD